MHEDIMDAFGVSMPQASLDLKEYRRRRREMGAPPDMKYNESAKRYEVI